MRRYFGRKLFTYLLTFFVAATIDWMIPRFMPGDPDRGPGGQDERRVADSRPRRWSTTTPTLRPEQSTAGSVPELLGFAAPRRPRIEHLRQRAARGLHDHGGGALHAGPSDTGDPAELVGRQQLRGPRGAAQVARQHDPARGLRPDRDAVHVACDRPVVRPVVQPADLSALRRLRLQPRTDADLVVLHGPGRPLGPAVPVAVPRHVRRLGDRDEEHDHLRAGVGLQSLPGGARRPSGPDPQVRFPQRDAAADHGPGSSAGRDRCRGARH